MSKYTQELRYILEQMYDNKEELYPNVRKVINNAIPKVFDFDLPPCVFPEGLEQLKFDVLRHFYTREIGLETWGLFKLKLEDVFASNMERLNREFEIMLKKIDPLIEFETWTDTDTDFDAPNDVVTTDHTGSSNTASAHTTDPSSHSSTTTLANGHTFHSDTPETEIEDVQNGTYVSDATFEGNDVTVNGQNIDNHTDNSTHNQNLQDKTIENRHHDTHTIVHYKGHNTSAMKLLQEYRISFFDIDDLIYALCEPLFMQVW